MSQQSTDLASPLPEALSVLAAISEVSRNRELAVASAESLTGGLLSSHLAAAEGASEWFRGGLVAYARSVKHEVLGVPEGPVVSARAAARMAVGVRQLLRADYAVAVTGAGGPDSQDGRPPGTVYIGTVGRSGRQNIELVELDADPQEVLRQTVLRALEALLTCMEAGELR
ncbi:CinA family protein [Leucobacter sp. CSA1]|uniref:CinA family protein n=1 Tax=Leucobacter chromiisoli TaxID=2796471 RepID=A0A934Q6E1_9MICO|nr:CinA family protein [Leucobacter chromiisoli]MBK0419129.1 CinA family protein [Leucobacter chromiisoli]